MTDWFYFAICRKKKLAPKPSRKVREISEEEESEDEGPASGKRKREVCRVLKSFNACPGFGDSLKKLLPNEFKHCYSNEVACLLLFINERQNIWFAKYHFVAERIDYRLPKSLFDNDFIQAIYVGQVCIWLRLYLTSSSESTESPCQAPGTCL